MVFWVWESLVDGPASACLSAGPGHGLSFGGDHRPFDRDWRAVGLHIYIYIAQTSLTSNLLVDQSAGGPYIYICVCVCVCVCV